MSDLREAIINVLCSARPMTAPQQADAILAALQSQTVPAVPEEWMWFPVEAWDFLAGVGPLSGHHFGDRVTDDKTGRPKPFWWRSHIRQMLAAAPQPDHSPDAGKVELLPSVREYLQQGIDDATHCEDADQDHAFAKQLCDILNRPTPVTDAGKVVPDLTETAIKSSPAYRALYSEKQHLLSLLKERAADGGEPVGWIWETYGQRNFTAGTHHKNVLEADGLTLIPVYPHPAQPRNEEIAADLEAWLSQVRHMEGLSARDIVESAEIYIAQLRASQQEGGEG